jgi:tRNA nucleotidyltransferase (CCA-adding enzyme)
MTNPFTSKYIPGIIPQIELTKTEHQIIDILNSYTNFYNSNLQDSKKEITLRITGGWVRDKLLEHISHDIDIGIDNCSGEIFVMGLKEWLEENNEKIKIENNLNGEEDNKIHNIHKIKKNPDKSKHLETCTTKLFGLDIDFVNLRSELYTKDSRIPTITTGTPIEDAYRRDATLNALFFNLSTMKIEDLTGKGLEDLANGILRTPLEPTKTFLDDPLRCLRLIRFASNYGFKVDQLTLDSMKQNEIKVALDTKISRERIGVEIRKLFLNKRGISGVLYGLELIKEVDFSCIFDLGDTDVSKEWLIENSKHLKIDILENIDDILTKLFKVIEYDILPFDKYLNDTSDENDRLLFYLSLILNKWRDEKVKVGKKENFVSFFCVLNGLKMPLKLADNTALIIKNIENVRNDIKLIKSLKRSEIAKKIILPYQDKWKLNLLVNCCLQSFENISEYKIILNEYQQLIQLIYQLELENSFEDQVLLNGKDLMKIINKKPGPWLKTISEKLFTWQLDNPNCTKDEMINYLNMIKLQE